MKTPWRSSFHHLLVASAGARRSTSRASASAARRTWSNDQRGSMRTLTWMPREPDVLGQPTSPWSASTSRTTSATRRMSSQGTPGTGSRSTRSSSGWSRSSARTACGLRSRQPRLATQASPAASSITTSSAVRPDGNDSSTVRIQSGRDSGARFWKKYSPVGAVDVALEGHRPAARAAQRAVGHDQVVGDQVALGVARAGKHDLVRVGDRDLPAGDLDDLAPRWHGRKIAPGRQPARGADSPTAARTDGDRGLAAGPVRARSTRGAWVPSDTGPRGQSVGKARSSSPASSSSSDLLKRSRK